MLRSRRVSVFLLVFGHVFHPPEVRHWLVRRFDLEHTFRMIKQTLGWTRPKFRTPEAGHRWTWLVIATHTQLRLLRRAAADLRRPWEQSAEPGRLTLARIRRRCRNLRPHLACPARASKPSRPGPEDRPARRTSDPPPATTWAIP